MCAELCKHISKLSIFTLRCIDAVARQQKGSPILSPVSAAPSNLSASDTTTVSEYAPDEYERKAYYNGITGDGDHPELVYRSDFHTTPFPKPVGRYRHIPVKSVREVYDTSLNAAWDDVGPKICDLITKRKISCSSIDPAHFFTHPTPGEEEKGSLGPAVIWIGVHPGSTSSETAHEVSQEILALLREHGVKDAVVEWREAVLQRLAGPPLMRHVGSANPTHYVRRFLTALPLATEGMEAEDAQGALTLWFLENKDKNGNPSFKVYGVSNCHVLRKYTTVDYEHRGGAPKDFVRVCGVRRFQRGLDEIKKHISDHGIRASYYTQEIDGLEAVEKPDEVVLGEIAENRGSLGRENEVICQFEALYDEVTKYWLDIKLDRDIGYVQHAEAIKVDVEGGTRYTSDWGAFLATEARVKDSFEGNVVDLGSKYSPEDLMAMFYPRGGGGATTFKFSAGRKLRIVGCATEEDLANPTEFDSEGDRCFIVGKDGNTTDLTVGRYAGLVSFTLNDSGVWSKELGIYNSGLKNAEVFSAKGDSGSLVWCTKNGQAFMVGQLHSGENKGGSTSNHVTYCTRGWYLQALIKEHFKHANFYPTRWPA